jgi:hypothetical protein
MLVEKASAKASPKLLIARIEKGDHYLPKALGFKKALGLKCIQHYSEIGCKLPLRRQLIYE